MPAPSTPAPTDLNRSGSGAPAAGHAVRDLFSTDEIFQRLLATADEEFVKSTRQLFLSGLAAGLSIGLSFLARAAVTGALGSTHGAAGLAGNLLYPIGFLFIALGRYQLFTENTLTPVTLVLTRIASVPMLLRVWGVVLAANLVGAVIIALVLAWTAVLEPSAAAAATAIALHGLETPWGALFVKGAVAGWLVASMVWLVHAARDTVSRFLIVFAVIYVIPLCGLYHCIIGAAEMVYLVALGHAGLGEAFFAFFVPVLLGNTVGGVVLVGLLNYAQTKERRFPERFEHTLTWREFLFTRQVERPDPLSRKMDEPPAEESLLDRPVPVREAEEA